MSSAPAWVTYAALALAALSLVVSVLAYRAGGPRLRLFAELASADDLFAGGATFRLTVVNAGRAAVTVESFHVTPYGQRKTAAAVEDVVGPNLPHRLEAHASESWLVDALRAAREYDAKIRGGLRPRSSWPSKFRFTVAVGNGKIVRTRLGFDSLRLIADSQPGS